MAKDIAIGELLLALNARRGRDHHPESKCTKDLRIFKQRMRSGCVSFST